MLNNFAIDHIVGNSAWTQRVRRRILQIASYRYSVLVTGATGTGKELVARAIHVHGPRQEKPFIPVNCASISGTLFTSQLFGHVKGAFTGAQHSALGCFRAADGGTIFLDEIGDLDLECQAKLLRVLQERKVVPVGAHEGTPVDVRVIAATNRNLEEEVRAGRFRLDLYYRLNILSIETLGLKDRVEDIEPLVKHFLAKTAIENGLPLKSLTDEAMALLKAYNWPGNVRELQNLIERAVVFSDDEMIGPEAFPQVMESGVDLCDLPAGGMASGPEAFAPTELAEPAPLSDPMSSPPAEIPDEYDAAEGRWQTLAQMECEHIRRTLQETFFNQSAAARLLGIDRKLLARKIKKYQLRVPQAQRGRPRKAQYQ